MNNDLNLERLASAFEELEYEQRTSSDLENARNKEQMRKYLESLDYSLRRLKVLQETVNELVEEKQLDLVKQEKIQTFKTKIIHIAREYSTSYQEILEVMAKLRR